MAKNLSVVYILLSVESFRPFFHSVILVVYLTVRRIYVSSTVVHDIVDRQARR